MHCSADRTDGWRPEEDRKIIELRALGFPWKDIAERISRTADGCSNRYRRIFPQEERRTIRKGARWTPAEEAQIKTLRDDGVKPRAIAALMGKELQAVYSKIQQLRQPGRGIDIEMEPRVWVPPHLLVDRDQRARAERDLTSLLCGDPAPGQSALDKRLSQSMQGSHA